MGNAGEAIAHFLKHIKLYKSPSAIGHSDLEYLHWGWVSRQYLVFGQLLDNLGIGNIQATGSAPGGWF